MSENNSLTHIPNNVKCVYFISANNEFVKIGIASQLRTRFKSIKTDCPQECELIGYIPTNNQRKLEAELHKRFSKYHCRGEWFYHTLALNEEIKALKGLKSPETEQIVDDIKESVSRKEQMLNAENEWKSFDDALEQDGVAYIAYHKEYEGIPIKGCIKRVASLCGVTPDFIDKCLGGKFNNSQYRYEKVCR